MCIKGYHDLSDQKPYGDLVVGQQPFCHHIWPWSIYLVCYVGQFHKRIDYGSQTVPNIKG